MSTEPWLILSLCPGLSTARAQQLIDNFGSAAATLKTSRSGLHAAGVSDAVAEFLLHPDESRLRQATDWLGADKRHLLCLNDADYPPLLKESGEIGRAHV